jgi:phosphate transport system substrate-binding protein
MFRKLLVITSLSVLGILSACQQQSSTGKQSYTKGKVNLVADESLAPIVEDQLFVFGSVYPEVEITPLYKPENALLKDLLNGTAKVAVMTRTLTPAESKYFEPKQIRIRVNRIAIDGIALITQTSNPDSLVSVQDVISVLQSKPSKIQSLVFDNPNSSTVRYFKELAQVKELPSKGIYALKSNPEVIKYVASHPGSIGVVGINWLMQADLALEKDIARLRVMGVKNLPGKPGADQYTKPDQNDLALGLYPFMRNLYLINCEGGPGPGTGFVTFVAGERGQRIVLKSGLLPDSIPPREISIRK